MGMSRPVVFMLMKMSFPYPNSKVVWKIVYKLRPRMGKGERRKIDHAYNTSTLPIIDLRSQL